MKSLYLFSKKSQMNVSLLGIYERLNLGIRLKQTVPF